MNALVVDFSLPLTPPDMPDPAIAAFNAGMPYTEPTSHGLFGRKQPKAKVTFVTNPNDPTQAPRRVISVDGSGGGWWGRKWGGRGVVQDEKVRRAWRYELFGRRVARARVVVHHNWSSRSAVDIGRPKLISAPSLYIPAKS